MALLNRPRKQAPHELIARYTPLVHQYHKMLLRSGVHLANGYLEDLGRMYKAKLKYMMEVRRKCR